MTNEQSLWAVILAAGKGSRLAHASNGTPKQFLEYHSAPLFWHSARTLAGVAAVKGVVFVFPKDGFQEASALLDSLWGQEDLGLPYRAVPGGDRRQDSVFEGLQALDTSCSAVLIHDAARPFVSPRLIAELAAELAHGTAAVIPCIQVKDTIKRVHETLVVETLRRDSLRAVQTPQGFDVDILFRAHKRARARDWDVTDDASMVERLDVPVAVIQGDATNIKITTAEDLQMLTSDIGAPEPCVGFGYDVHAYVGETEPKARPLKLGGVPIAGGPCVKAHSDGDVLLHALADALLGCLGGGDIGDRFPDSDPKFEGMESGVLVDEILADVRKANIRLTHVDMTIVAQIPRIAPHKNAIRRNIARLLALDESRVNVKATTEEKLGFTGAKKGIKATATVAALRPAV